MDHTERNHQCLEYQLLRTDPIVAPFQPVYRRQRLWWNAQLPPHSCLNGVDSVSGQKAQAARGRTGFQPATSVMGRDGEVHESH